MVADASRDDELGRLNERLGGQIKLAIVPIGELRLLEKNARYMRHETFRRLVDNIKRDGGLSSVPFCYREPESGQYLVLSGNHRVMAAKEAGLEEVLILYTDRPMSRQEQVAVQLSHNALVGEDDPVILRELYREIDDLALKYYSGLDDKLLGELEKVKLTSLSEAQLDYLTITLLFLPEEADRLKAALEKARAVLHSEAVAARWADYDRLLDALTKVKSSYDIRNGAVALMIILDIFERHLEDLRDGWLDEATGEARHKRWVPLASVLGTDAVPAQAALVLQKALEKMLASGEINGRNKWQALEYWAADYLGS